jgi:hypothetical protein
MLALIVRRDTSGNRGLLVFNKFLFGLGIPVRARQR